MNKILVVDDDLDILSLVQAILGMNNFTVEAISRWEDIGSKMAEFKPNLVLLDVMLAGADGRDICKNLQTQKETKDIPVILFSANPEMGKYIKDCMAKDFVAKPFEMAQLLKTVRTYLN
jgi:DNA-binding response OmpR family regulator